MFGGGLHRIVLAVVNLVGRTLHIYIYIYIHDCAVAIYLYIHRNIGFYTARLGLSLLSLSLRPVWGVCFYLFYVILFVSGSVSICQGFPKITKLERPIELHAADYITKYHLNT